MKKRFFKIAMLVCAILIIVGVVALGGLNRAAKTGSGSGVIKSTELEKIEHSVPFYVEIPAIIYQEKGLEVNIVLNEIVDITNNNIHYRMMAFKSHRVDAGGFYEEFETDDYYDFDGNIIRARGAGGKYYVLDWIYEGTAFSIYYKRGLEPEKAFGYLGINIESIMRISAEQAVKTRKEQYPKDLFENEQIDVHMEKSANNETGVGSVESDANEQYKTIKFSLATVDIPVHIADKLQITEVNSSQSILITCANGNTELIAIVAKGTEETRIGLEEQMNINIIHEYADGEKLIYGTLKMNPLAKDANGYEEVQWVIENANEISRRIGVLAQ